MTQAAEKMGTMREGTKLNVFGKQNQFAHRQK